MPRKVESEYRLANDCPSDSSDKSQNLVYCACGVSMVEFTFIFPVLMLIVVGIIDLCRFYTIRAVLNTGAELAIKRAISMPNLDVDIRGLDPNDIEYRRYKIARQKVLQEAVKVPVNTLLADYTDINSGARLLKMTMRDDAIAVGEDPPPEINYGAAVLRPGECVDVEGQETKKCNRETLGLSPEAQAPEISPESLMKRHPIKVYLQAELETFLPFIDVIKVHGESSGFREEVPQGPFADAEDPTGGTTTTTVTTSTILTTSTVTTSTTTTTVSCVSDLSSCIRQSNSTQVVRKPGNFSDLGGLCSCQPLSAIDFSPL